MIHQPVSVVSQCSAGAWLNELASGDQRGLTGSGSASEVCLRRCAIQIHRYSLCKISAKLVLHFRRRWVPHRCPVTMKEITRKNTVSSYEGKTKNDQNTNKLALVKKRCKTQKLNLKQQSSVQEAHHREAARCFIEYFAKLLKVIRNFEMTSFSGRVYPCIVTYSVSPTISETFSVK